MRRFFILLLVLVVLISIFAVPAFAATTADSQAASLQSGWLSSYAPTGYSSSWFWAVLSKLDSVYDYVYSSNLKLIDIVSDTGSIDSKLTDVKSALNSVKTSVDSLKSSVDLVKTSVDNMKSSVDSMKTTLTGIGTDIGLIESGVDTIRSEVVSIDSTTTTISSTLSDVKSKVTDIELNTDYLKTINSYTSSVAALSSSLQFGSWLTSGGDGNWFKVLFNALNSVSTNTSKLVSVFATPADIELKDSQADEEKAVLSGIAKVDRVGNINDFSGLEGDLKDYFAMDDVNIGLMFGQVEDGYRDWFSSYTASCLAVGGGASAVSGAAAATYGLDRAAHEEPDTPYLDAYAAEVASILAGGDPD